MGMRSKDLNKQALYESVKILIDSTQRHIHLPQQKLFTLFSLAFQYFLFCSTKEKGAYIIRVEDSALAEKLARKSKDPSTRKFIQSLLLPRKLKYGNSTFYMDFFHIGSWSLTSDIPKERIKGALIVKNTSSRPMTELMDTEEEELTEQDQLMAQMPKDYFLTSLMDFVPKTVTIAYDYELEGLEKIEFPFIKKDRDRVQGLTLSKDIDLDSIE